MTKESTQLAFEDAKPFLGVVILNEGMSNFTLIIAPFAFFLDKKIRPKMTISAFLELRLEKVKMMSIRSQAELLGTLATVAGAMIIDHDARTRPESRFSLNKRSHKPCTSTTRSLSSTLDQGMLWLGRFHDLAGCDTTYIPCRAVPHCMDMLVRNWRGGCCDSSSGEGKYCCCLVHTMGH